VVLQQTRWGRPHKKKIIARDRGYHGASITLRQHDRHVVLSRRIRPAGLGRAPQRVFQITGARPRGARAKRTSPPAARASWRS
jgi:hypothetical protein